MFGNRGVDEEDVEYIYLMEYYSVIKKDKLVPFVTTQMERKGIILTEVNQKINEPDSTYVCNLEKPDKDKL